MYAHMYMVGKYKISQFYYTKHRRFISYTIFITQKSQNIARYSCENLRKKYMCLLEKYRLCIYSKLNICSFYSALFNQIDHRKLTSRLSTILVEILFFSKIAVIKAFDTID